MIELITIDQIREFTKNMDGNRYVLMDMGNRRVNPFLSLARDEDGDLIIMKAEIKSVDNRPNE
ncbi:hypothetical protein [Bacillus mojavensis]